MYPYNRNTQIYNTKIQAKEDSSAKNGKNGKANKNGNQDADLSLDRRLMELLTLAREETEQMAERYQAMMENPDLTEATELFKPMYLDEQKHKKQLREAMFTITKDTPEEVAATPVEKPADSKQMLEDTLLLEMDDISFYRDLLLNMPDNDLRDIFFEIVTDKQNHCNGLNYIMIKYFS